MVTRYMQNERLQCMYVYRLRTSVNFIYHHYHRRPGEHGALAVSLHRTSWLHSKCSNVFRNLCRRSIDDYINCWILVSFCQDWWQRNETRTVDFFALSLIRRKCTLMITETENRQCVIDAFHSDKCQNPMHKSFAPMNAVLMGFRLIRATHILAASSKPEWPANILLGD